MYILYFYNHYEHKPTVLGTGGSNLTYHTYLTEFPQPKRIWDALHTNGEKVTDIYDENSRNPPIRLDPQSELRQLELIQVKPSLAAFRRGVQNNAFVQVYTVNSVPPIPRHFMGGNFINQSELQWSVAGMDELNATSLRKRLKLGNSFFCMEKKIVPNPIFSKAVERIDIDKPFTVLIFKNSTLLDFRGADNQNKASNEKKRENDIWTWYRNVPGMKVCYFKSYEPPRTYQKEYGKIRSMITREQPGNIFKWQNLCREIAIKSKMSEIRELAKTFGVPPSLWNNPRKVCAIITPRASDFMEHIHCDNAEEPTMDGDEVGSIPEYLKYTFVAGNGQTYCSNVLDLYNAVNSGQQMDPYRRFPLDRKDITERVEFLRKVIEPHGLGAGIMSKIRDTMIALTPGQQLRARLVHVWGKLRYPKLSIEEVMNAEEPIVNGIFAAMIRQEGIAVTSQEKNAFYGANGDVGKKRTILIDTMNRIVNIDDPSQTNLVSLELAINDSSPQQNTREREDDTLATVGNERARAQPFERMGVSNDRMETDEFNDDDDDTMENEDDLAENDYRRFEEWSASRRYNPGDIRIRDNDIAYICYDVNGCGPGWRTYQWTRYEGGPAERYIDDYDSVERDVDYYN